MYPDLSGNEHRFTQINYFIFFGGIVKQKKEGVNNLDNNKFVSQLVRKILEGELTTKEEIYKLFSSNRNCFDLLFSANNIRERYKQEKIDLCGVINAKSGLCNQDCKFCAQASAHSVDIDVYPLLSKEKIVNHAKIVVKNNASHYGIVTSGKKVNDKEIKIICDSIKEISRKYPVRVDASLGTLDLEHFIKLKEAGLQRYHHNLETSEHFFPKICTTHSYQDRINTIKNAKSAGLKVCSGGLFGLGEDWKDRIDLAFLLKDLQVDSIPLNFLSPVKGTALGEKEKISPIDALKTIFI
ncbi:biotin synthase BioB [Chlamydiota bacterium]